MGTIPEREIRPRVGRMLKRLLADAGERSEFTGKVVSYMSRDEVLQCIDIPVSVPVPKTANDVAIAAPVPPELPPGVRVWSYGLIVWDAYQRTLLPSPRSTSCDKTRLTCPPSEETDSPSKANSCKFALPNITAPSLLNACATGASTSGTLPLKSSHPAVVFIPTAS